MATLTIISPPDGATVGGITHVLVDAPGVKQVNFYVDGVLKGRDKAPPFVFEWYTTRYPDGKHTVKAVSSSGRFKDEATVTVRNASVGGYGSGRYGDGPYGGPA